MSARVTVAEYVTAPSGTVHLVDAHLMPDFSENPEPARTLCGRVIGWEADGWGWRLEETTSGIGATCRRCRWILRGPR